MISVIIPVYNVEKVLHYCIDSFLSQTYSDFELLLINDGSTDGSGLICDVYSTKDSRIRVIHKKNEGVSSARNIGIESAEGEYICFADSDDYVESDFLQVLVYTQEKNKQKNIWCAFFVVNNYERKIIQTVNCESEIFSCYQKSEIIYLYNKWMLQMIWNKLYCKSVIIGENIRFREDLSLGEDIIFNLEYLDKTKGEILVLNRPLYYYIKNEKESLDNKFYINLNAIYRELFDELFQYAEKYNIDQRQRQLLINARFFAFENVFQNTFLSKSTIKHRFRFNNRIIKSTEFSEVFRRVSCGIHPLVKLGYRLKSYRIVRMVYFFAVKKQ